MNILLRFCLSIILITFCPIFNYAQNSEERNVSDAIVTNSFWDNFYGQVGLDMSLQNPYGCNFMNVFPNGKSFGVDAAVGKWFTPKVGARVKLNLENAFLKSDHAEWVNMYDKGYLTLLGDFQFDVQNIFGNYKSDRKWTLTVYPRAGAFVDLGTGKGSPVLGLGIGNTFRINDKWGLYADVAYQVMTSVNGVATGTGSGSNGYFDINVGVQYNIGKQKFHRVSDNVKHDKHAVVLNSFWDNWFVQAGVGMSLLNLYGSNFGKVFPNGKTLGVNLGLGKWITPELGIRGGLNWQNGIVGNNHLYWLDKDGPGSNHKAGGYIAAYGDVLLNLHHLFDGYDKNRFWNAIVFARAGLDSNLEGNTGSPLVGLGTEQTFKLSNRLKLYCDLAYQVTSTEFVYIEGRTDHSGTGAGSNGWFDLNVGVQYEFGRNTWDKLGEKRTLSHWEGGHNWPRFIVNTAASVGVGFGVKTVLKKAIKEERPDHSDNESFPSGHATMAFAAARSIDKEFRKESIWIPIVGYAAATAVGVERVVSDRHHWYDVVAGAGLGFGAAELTWWLSEKLFPGSKSSVVIGSSGNTLDVAVKVSHQ